MWSSIMSGDAEMAQQEELKLSFDEAQAADKANLKA